MMFCKFCKNAPLSLAGCAVTGNLHVRRDVVVKQCIRGAFLRCRDAFIGKYLVTAQQSTHRAIHCYQARGHDNSVSCLAIDVLKTGCLVESGQDDQKQTWPSQSDVLTL